MKGGTESHVSGFSHRKVVAPQRLTGDLGFGESHKVGISSVLATREKVLPRVVDSKFRQGHPESHNHNAWIVTLTLFTFVLLNNPDSICEIVFFF